MTDDELMTAEKFVKFQGQVYPLPDFDVEIKKIHGQKISYDLLDVSTWQDLSTGKQLFILYKVIRNDRT